MILFARGVESIIIKTKFFSKILKKHLTNLMRYVIIITVVRIC